MWPASVVVCDPLLEKAPQVPLIERDQKIKAFAANRADQSLYEGVRKRHVRNSLDFGYLEDPKIRLHWWNRYSGS